MSFTKDGFVIIVNYPPHNGKRLTHLAAIHMLKPQKNFVGPRLRQLRREHGQTQAVMAASLGLSPAYINLLENNQRSLSVQVLLRLSEVYGVD